MLTQSKKPNQNNVAHSSSRPRFSVWLLMVILFACSGFVFMKGSFPASETYTVYADFQSVAGMSNGAPIEIAGIKVGFVDGISLTPDDMARVGMKVRKDIALPEDSIVSIRTRGLMGNKALVISRGGSPDYIAPGGVLMETESSIDFEQVVGRLIFGSF